MSYKISDTVAMRMIQIFQEALLLGLDGADLMRQVRLVVDESNTDTLTLDPNYEKQVADMHAKYLAEAETLKQKSLNDQDPFKLVFENWYDFLDNDCCRCFFHIFSYSCDEWKKMTQGPVQNFFDVYHLRVGDLVLPLQGE